MLDSLEIFSSSKNRSSKVMEVDKRDGECGNVYDNKEEVDVPERIEAK